MTVLVFQVVLDVDLLLLVLLLVFFFFFFFFERTLQSIKNFMQVPKSPKLFLQSV